MRWLVRRLRLSMATALTGFPLFLLGVEGFSEGAFSQHWVANGVIVLREHGLDSLGQDD